MKKYNNSLVKFIQNTKYERGTAHVEQFGGKAEMFGDM